MRGMAVSKKPLSNTPTDDDAEDEKPVPSVSDIWKLTKANLIGLGLVVVSFVGVGLIVIRTDNENDRKRTADAEEQRVQRRADFCGGIRYALTGPLVDTFAVAFEEPLDSPVVQAARNNLSNGLGPDCTGPVGGIPQGFGSTTTTAP